MPRSDVIKISGTTTEQRATWRRAAGPSLSAWIRFTADRAASGVPGGTLSAVQTERLETVLIALRADLNRGVGNNLNQVATALNASLKAGQGADPRLHALALAQAVRELRAIRKRVSDALDVLASVRP